MTERLWQSGHLQRVSRLLRGGKARIAVAVGLSKAVERRSVPGCPTKLILFSFVLGFLSMLGEAGRGELGFFLLQQ